MPKEMRCIKPYTVKTFPKDYVVEVGEILTVKGYLMGRDIVLAADVTKHPPDYKHLTENTFVVFDKNKLKEHFQERTNA
jgi:hypothetical protein